MLHSLHDASAGAQTLIGETAAEAKTNAHALVGEAMAECERLLRTSGELSAEAADIRTRSQGRGGSAASSSRRCPASRSRKRSACARWCAARPRKSSISPRARCPPSMPAPRRASRSRASRPSAAEPEQPESEGLLGMAKRLTQRPRKAAAHRKAASPNRWEMRTLLAAVETGEIAKGFQADRRRGVGRARGGAADMAVDLDGITGDGGARRGGVAALSRRRPRRVRAPAGRRDRRRHGQPHRHALSRRTALPRRRQHLHHRVRSACWRAPRKAMAAAC